MQELNAYVANESTQSQPQPHIHTNATYYVHNCKMDNSVCNHTSHWRIQGEGQGGSGPPYHADETGILTSTGWLFL